jgi:hypothetical protein
MGSSLFVLFAIIVVIAVTISTAAVTSNLGISMTFSAAVPQPAFGQGDIGNTVEPSDGAGPSDGGGGATEPTDDVELTDGTEPTGGGSEEPSDVEPLNGKPPSTEAYVCNGDTNTCSCRSWRDCQKMYKDGVCVGGGNPLWGLNLDEKTVPEDAKSGSCSWNK